MKFRGKELPEVEMNMTPMIDCVFQLIIFFMIVIDFSQRDLEAVELPPVSPQIGVDDKGDPKRIIINICRGGKQGDWIIIVQRRQMSLEELENHLNREKLLGETSKIAGRIISERPVMIRADRDAKFGVVQKVLAICAKAGFYKLQFGAKLKESE